MIRLSRQLSKRTIKPLLATNHFNRLRQVQRYNYIQVQDIQDEQIRQKEQILYDNKDAVEVTDRIYKPTNTIEFDRIGEVVLYSATPLKSKRVYLVYPYIANEMLIPPCLYMYYFNPFDFTYGISWCFIFMSFMLCFPRVWYIKSLNQRIEKLSLLRGGKVLRVQSSTIYGDRLQSFIHTRELRPLTEDFANFDDRDNADFLDQTGQLKYELGVEADYYTIQGLTYNDYNIFFTKEGMVHQPELFEAVVKGYNVDTSDFVINTAHNERALEPNLNN